jgi:CRISPR-associated protein Cas2
VQKSAFEAILKESVYERMTAMIPRLIDPEEDTVRVYRFSGYGNVQLFGNSEKIIDEEVIIV